MKPLKISGTAADRQSPTCPRCGAVLAYQAIVDAFGVPENWTGFYGHPQKPGEDPTRWIRCQGRAQRANYTHFVVEVRGGLQHRLAWHGLEKNI